MLTRMSGEDWTVVLEVFDAVHFFTVRNLTWRALPAEYGRWNSDWKRFWRLSRSGVFEAFFQVLAETSKTAHLVQMFGGTVVRARLGRRRRRGQHARALPRLVLAQDPPQDRLRRPADRL